MADVFVFAASGFGLDAGKESDAAEEEDAITTRGREAQK
jgi:hypothetical protein